MAADPAIVVGIAALAGLAAGTVAASDAIRSRARIVRRMRPLDLLDDEVAHEEAAPQGDDAAAPRPLAAFLHRRYPLSGGPRTAAVAAATGTAASVALTPALAFVGVPLTLAMAAALLLGAGLAWSVGTTLEQRVRHRFQERFLLVIEDFERMVRSGIGTTQAVASNAESAEEPVRASIAKVARDAELGVPLGLALAREAHRVRISEMAMFSAIVSAQSRTGGGITEAASNLAEMLRERIDNRARLGAATAESKITLLILAALPVVLVALQAWTQPQIFETLLGPARHLLGIGGALIAAGLATAYFIVRSATR